MKTKPACLAMLLIAGTSAALSAEQAPGTKSPADQPSASPQPANAAPATPGAKERVAADRLDLDVSVVTGNRELPKVLYIVPWKKAELGDLPAQPFNSLLDEALKPVDRDEFRREVAYFSRLTDRPAASSAEGEKSSIAPTPSR